MITTTTIEEDVDLVGVSMHNGTHLTLAPAVVHSLRAAGLETPVIIGGIVPPSDIPVLISAGVTAVLGPGASNTVPADSSEARRDGGTMTGYSDPASGWEGLERAGGNKGRRHAIRATLGRTNRSRSTKDFVFGELRTALEALRGLHTRARAKDSANAHPRSSSSQYTRGTSTPSSGIPARGIIGADERAAVSSFVIDEDSGHLEEAVLIALDFANTDNVQSAWTETNQTLHQLSRGGMDYDLQRGSVDRRQKITLGRFVADDLYDSGGK
jgi:hypothetical protein